MSFGGLQHQRKNNIRCQPPVDILTPSLRYNGIPTAGIRLSLNMLKMGLSVRDRKGFVDTIISGKLVEYIADVVG